MSGDFHGRVALITGAGDEMGLGFAYARHLSDRGARIVLNDYGGGTLGLAEQGVDAAVAERAAARLRESGAEVISNNGDVAHPSTAVTMVEAAIEAWGRVDIVINNAGIASAEYFPDISRSDVDLHTGVTLAGCINTARAAWPHMVERNYGRIVNTGSPACFGNAVATYAATKASLFGLTRTEAIFGEPHNIAVNLVLPAALSRLTSLLPESEFKDILKADFGSDEVAPVVAHLVSETCTHTGEAFLAGAGKVARTVYAATPAVDIGGSIDDAMAEVMSSTEFAVMGSTADAMVHLGVPEDVDQ